MGYVCMGHTIFGTIMVDFSSLGYAVALIHRFISSRQVNESKKSHGKFWLREFFRLKGFNGALGFGAPLQVLVNSREVSEVRETSTEKTANFCFKFLASEDLKIQLVEVPYPRTSALIFPQSSTNFRSSQTSISGQQKRISCVNFGHFQWDSQTKKGAAENVCCRSLPAFRCFLAPFVALLPWDKPIVLHTTSIGTPTWCSSETWPKRFHLEFFKKASVFCFLHLGFLRKQWVCFCFLFS